MITDNGQMIMPFFQLRGDVASLDVTNEPGVANFIATGQSELARAMPAAGVEYRYPFVDVEPWGTQTFQPIAQLDPASERNRHRPISERGRAEPGVRHSEPVFDR